MTRRKSYAEPMPGPSGRRRLRFLAPVAVAGAIALGAWIPTLSASASPQLPNQTVDQLIARAEQPSVTEFTGSIEWTANMGLPSLSGLTSVGGQSSDGFNWTDLLSGSHQIKVWDGAANGQRLALIGSASEVDLYSSSEATGSQTWLYDSSSNTATHLVPGAHQGTASPRDAKPSDGPALTPQQVATQVLQQVEGVTDVSVSPATYIAGQPAYVLSLAPKAGAPGASASTIGNIAIGIDADNGAVLQVSVTPVGATTPALSLGFTTVHFESKGSKLPASDFAYTPPSGTTVTTQTLGGATSHTGTQSPSAAPTTVGSAWGSVVIFHGAGNLLAGAASSATAQVSGSSPPRPVLTRPKGSGALSVRGHRHDKPSSSQQVDGVTTPVTGSFGTGRLLSTSLVNFLVLPNGDVAAGFVTPQALEAAVSNAG